MEIESEKNNYLKTFTPLFYAWVSNPGCQKSKL